MLLIVGVPETLRQTDAGHGATAATASKRRLESYPEAKKHFPAGVMAGDAESLSAMRSRAVLWTKYYIGEKKLKVRVLETFPRPGRRPPGIKQDQTVKVKKERFVHFDARGLKPGVRYKYAFLEESDSKISARSPVGHFTTPIAPDSLGKVVFGGTSCTFQYGPPLRRTNRNLRHASRQHPDLSFFVHLGDQLYCDALKVKRKPATKLKDYRSRYQHAFSQPGLNALHKAFGMYTTWDDHEVFDGWQGKYTTLELLAPKLKSFFEKNKINIRAVMKAGTKSFCDHQPIRPVGERKDESKGLWRSFRWGRTLELFILDCRSERNVSKSHKHHYPYISAAQENWLMEHLAKSDAVFKFILNSCPIGYFDKHHRRPPKKCPVRPKQVEYSWKHPWVVAQRERILEKVRGQDGVWWLSGDVHFGCVGGVDPDKKPSEKFVGEVLMGPGGNWPPKESEKHLKNRLKRSGHTCPTRDSNYVVIHANPAEEREHSTLDIYFYGGRRGRPTQRLHKERRNYAGKKIEWPKKK